MSSLPNETRGYLLGLVAVAAFAITLPATRIAVQALDPVFVGLGRALGAAVLAAVYLVLSRQRLPTRREFLGLMLVSACVAVGFPLTSAWAMLHVEATHGGVVLGILPLATMVAAVFLSGERPSLRFWLFAVSGTAIVVTFSLSHADGGFRLADLALFGAIVCAAIGYAEGARLSRSLGGLQVISWALVIAAPVLVTPVVLTAPSSLDQPWACWLGFVYVMVISQFLGFVPWYRGLTMGGIAKVSQTQLLQPFLTILASAMLLGESADTMTWVVAFLVVGVVIAGRTARVAQAEPVAEIPLVNSELPAIK